MIKVTCALPNASTNINGIDFDPVDGGVVAVMSDETAEQFNGIPGYTLEAAGEDKPATKKKGGE
jgi:hypothetical protein